MKRYDVFVSYRRSSYESANLIATRLKAAGYSVFFDLETMRSGLFNEQLYSVIEDCKDFILVLPPDALDRCSDEEDWVRKEVLHAMAHDKNIVPVMLNGFQWPSPMPDGMEQLCMYQAVTASKDYFDLALQRLESYLKSRRKTIGRRILKWGSIVAATLVILYFIAVSLFKMMAVPTCRQMAETLTSYISIADNLMADNALLMSEWQRSEALEDFEEYNLQMDIVSANLEDYEKMFPKVHELSSWQNFLLSLFDADQSYADTFAMYIRSLMGDVSDAMSYSASLMEDGVSPSERLSVDANLQICAHTINAMYCTYVQIVNEFPEDARKPYYDMAEKFRNMPSVGLGMSSKEYDIMISREFEKIDDLAGKMKSSLHTVQDQVYAQERKLDSLNNDALERYRSYVKDNAVKDGDDLGTNWSRVCMIADFLGLVVEAAREDAEEGFEPGPLSPALVLGDLNAMLQKFVTLYPDYRKSIESASVFYGEVAEGTRPLRGVLISIFAPGHSHDVYELGDIITSWNGVEVKNLSELKNAYRLEDGNGRLSLLRLKNGRLKQMEMQIPGGEDVVGFSNLTLE